MTELKRLGYRYQRSITRVAEVQGIGFLTGASVRLRFLPAPPGSGITFQRTDVRSAAPIAARVDQITGTDRRTTLGRAPNQVELVEHVLAALAGLRVDNCTVQLNAPEPPGLDGSARPLVEALVGAGIALQPARRAVWTVAAPLKLTCNDATLAFYPGDRDFRISYLLDYGRRSPIGWQVHTALITPENFRNEVCACRTFLLESEAAELLRQGLGAKTTAADLLVFGSRGPIGNRVRFADEPARHKILDLVGDLSLFGHDLRGHIVAYRSGHPLNAQLARTLVRELAQTGSAPLLAA